MNKWAFTTDQTLNHHNIATALDYRQAKEKLAWSPECVDSQNAKITCSENALECLGLPIYENFMSAVNFACSTVQYIYMRIWDTLVLKT